MSSLSLQNRDSQATCSPSPLVGEGREGGSVNGLQFTSIGSAVGGACSPTRGERERGRRATL